MSRPNNISNEDISRWDEIIDSEENLPSILKNSAVIKEVCYAGQWLSEELRKLDCKEDHIVRIAYTCGQLSFGRDPWDVAIKMLEAYKANDLEFEPDLSELN
jgi:hypothetical protein